MAAAVRLELRGTLICGPLSMNEGWVESLQASHALEFQRGCVQGRSCTTCIFRIVSLVSPCNSKCSSTEWSAMDCVFDSDGRESETTLQCASRVIARTCTLSCTICCSRLSRYSLCIVLSPSSSMPSVAWPRAVPLVSKSKAKLCRLHLPASVLSHVFLKVGGRAAYK